MVAALNCHKKSRRVTKTLRAFSCLFVANQMRCGQSIYLRPSAKSADSLCWKGLTA